MLKKLAKLSKFLKSQGLSLESRRLNNIIIRKMASENGGENNNLVFLDLVREKKREEDKDTPSHWIVVLDDLDTWSGDGYAVLLSENELDEASETGNLKSVLTIDAMRQRSISVMDLIEKAVE
jgi:hypothetical protein